MVLHLSLWSEEEGAPVMLCQHPRNDESVSLPTLSATNGVFSLMKHKGARLKDLQNENLEIFWKEVEEGLRLILIRSCDSIVDTSSCQSILQLAFLALKMSCSEDDLSPKNEEMRFYIKPAVSRVQNLLESVDSTGCHLGELLLLPDIVIVDNVSSIKSYLDAFCTGISVQYAAVYVFGRRAVCTTQWHKITAEEQVFLALLGRLMGPSNSRVDMPLYIPSLSRKIPFRFVMLTLLHGIDLILICGSHPPLTEISSEVRRFWAPAGAALRDTFQSIPRSLPPSLELPSEVTAFALLSREHTNSYCLASAIVTSVSGQAGPSSSSESGLDLNKRRELLRELLRETESHRELDFPLPEEGYYATSEYRAHYLRREPLLLLVVLNKNVPLLATGSIAESTMSALKKILPS